MDHEPPQHNYTVFQPGDPINPLRKTHQSGPVRVKRIHDAKITWLQVNWKEKLQALGRMSLQTLTIETTHCRCSSSFCCRPFIGLPIDYTWSSQRLTIKGFTEKLEAEFVKDKLHNCG